MKALKPALTKEKMIALMQYADGELAGEENEAARADVIASLESDPEARAFLEEMERLGDVTRDIEPLTVAGVADFDIADAVMGLVEEHEQKNAETARLDKKSDKGLKKVTGTGGVSSIEVAREKRRRMGVIVITGLALAAGIALVMRSQNPNDNKSATLNKSVDSVPALTASGKSPSLPSTSEAAMAAAANTGNGGALNPEVNGVEVNISDSPQTSVFYLPGSDGTSASAVVWIDESSGGNK
jgi:hypothetical protein